MRFKDLLFEYSDEELERLDKIVQEGNWLYNFDRPIYRADKVQKENFNIRETAERKETRDTIFYVDELIHLFYKNCFPNLPDRRHSRFGSVFRDNIEAYLNPTQSMEKESYAIFPHASAKISSRIEDPFTVLDEIKTFTDRILKYPLGENFNDLMGYIKERSQYLYRFVKFLDDLKNQKTLDTSISELGCPEKLESKVKQNVESLENDKLENSISNVARNIYRVFKNAPGLGDELNHFEHEDENRKRPDIVTGKLVLESMSGKPVYLKRWRLPGELCKLKA